VSGDPSYVMPFYLALDVSLGAERFSPYYWSGLSQLSAEFGKRPELAALTSIAVGMLDDDCRWTGSLPPARISMPPGATASTSPSYPALHRMAETVKAQIDSDVAAFRIARRRCCRPALIVLLASAGPAEGWRTAVGELTRYDAARGTGNRNHPVVLPAILGEETAGLAELVHPPGSSRLIVVRDTSDAMHCVRAAFEVIESFIFDSVRALAAGEARHIYPRPARYPADQPPARHGEPPEPGATSRRDLVAEIPEQVSPTGSASYVSIRCRRNGASMVAEFRQRTTAGWQLMTAAAVVADAPTAATKTLTGAFDISPTYCGCTNCGDRGITLCGCGHLNCWDGAQRTVRCATCGMTAEVAGNITQLRSID
jgi:hypothetical protein